MDKKIAGVVLAGGKSSRMGKNKAMLIYNGKPLLNHMVGILEKSGIEKVFISGDFEGYGCINDHTPHKGPAHAMIDVLAELHDYDGVLFVPVDMPFLSCDALRLLIAQEKSCFFKGVPLPAFITKPYPIKRSESVKELLKSAKSHSVILPSTLINSMKNINTPKEWKEAISA